MSCRRIADIGLVVLDPMRDVHTGEENDSGEMSAVMNSLRALSHLLDCTVLLVHHAAKGGGSRGSSAILGALDGVRSLSGLETDGVREFVNTVHPTVKGAQSAGAFKLALSVENDANGEAVAATWTVSRDLDEPGATTTRHRSRGRRARRVHQRPSGHGMSKIRTAKIGANRKGLNGQHLDAVRRRAVEQGKLFEEKIGKALVLRAIGGVP